LRPLAGAGWRRTVPDAFADRGPSPNDRANRFSDETPSLLTGVDLASAVVGDSFHRPGVFGQDYTNPPMPRRRITEPAAVNLVTGTLAYLPIRSERNRYRSQCCHRLGSRRWGSLHTTTSTDAGLLPFAI
jgi:hypothetical protein